MATNACYGRDIIPPPAKQYPSYSGHTQSPKRVPRIARSETPLTCLALARLQLFIGLLTTHIDFFCLRRDCPHLVNVFAAGSALRCFTYRRIRMSILEARSRDNHLDISSGCSGHKPPCRPFDSFPRPISSRGLENNIFVTQRLCLPQKTRRSFCAAGIHEGRGPVEKLSDASQRYLTG